MNHLRLALEDAKVLSQMKEVDKEPTSGLWFRHTSPYAVKELVPQSYKALQEIRQDYDVEARRATEQEYHCLLGTDSSRSFLYATVVGFHAMEEVLSYPGYTYFFQLSLNDVDKCIFDIVDKKKRMDPTKGLAGLALAKDLWRKHAREFKPFEEEGFGTVEPRIEVIVPFSVIPSRYVPQEEDR